MTVNNGLVGQWIGKFSGTNNGTAVFNLELKNGSYEGRVFLWDGEPSKPDFLIRVSLRISDVNIEGELTDFHPIGMNVLKPIINPDQN